MPIRSKFSHKIDRLGHLYTLKKYMPMAICVVVLGRYLTLKKWSGSSEFLQIPLRLAYGEC